MITAVSKAFRFALEHKEFGDAVLFADELPTELLEEERAAIEKVRAHVDDAVPDLLYACRDDLLNRFKPPLLDLLKQNKPQRKKLVDKWFFFVAVRTQGQYSDVIAQIDVGIGPHPKGEDRYVLFAAATVRTKLQEALKATARERGVDLAHGQVRCVITGDGICPSEGELFSVIAKNLGDAVEPWIKGLDTHLDSSP